MLDGFFTGKRWNELTKKQELELDVKDAVLDLILDRNQTFLESARKRQTSIFVQNREGGIRRFEHDKRKYISIPTSVADKMSGFNEYEKNKYLQQILKVSTINSNYDLKQKPTKDADGNEVKAPEITIDTYVDNLKNDYVKKSGLNDLDMLVDETGKLDTSLFELYSIKNKKDEKELEDSIEESEKSGYGTALSNKGMTDSTDGKDEARVLATGDSDSMEYKFEDTNLNIDAEIPKICKQNEYYREKKNCISKDREKKLQALAQRIVNSFKGRVSKDKRSTPTSRISTKDVCIDVSDKIYKTKKGNNGKHLKMNIIVDMSGSMDGEPVKNATEIIYIFNEIANAGYLEGSVLFSDTHGKCKIKFPMPRKMIGHMNQTGGGEGLGKNLKWFLTELKEVDTNICMTDGQLTDDPILKELYKKEKVEMFGVYVNKNAKDVTEYTGSLNRWFTKSIVRTSVEELCEKIIQFGLRRKQR